MAEYANIRDVLGSLIGQKVVDISQHDEEDWEEDGVGFVYFQFENGECLRFHLTCEDCGFELQEAGEVE